MPQENGYAQKLKLLYLIDLLKEQTDDNHGLSAAEIMSRLEEKGVHIERKTLYKDLDALCSYGFDIQKYQRSCIEYGLASREFQEQELLLLADAIQSSRFLTKKKSDALVDAVGKLGSKYIAQYLKKRIYVERRIKMQNESVFYNLDMIQEAINSRVQIRFQYCKYNEAKELVKQHDGRVYEETPLGLIYMDDCYYAVVWSESKSAFVNYRVDRMVSMKVSTTPACNNELTKAFNIEDYEKRSFSMFNGAELAVTLELEACAMSALIDKFGKDVRAYAVAPGIAHAQVNIMESPTFFAWLCTFGSDIRIVSPKSLQKSYCAYLESILAAYKKDF